MTKHDIVNKLSVALYHINAAEKLLYGSEWNIVDAREHIRSAKYQVELVDIGIKPEEITKEEV